MSHAIEDEPGTEESSLERPTTTESGTPNSVHERQPSTSALRVTRSSTLSDPFSIAPELNETQDTSRQGLRNRIQQSEEQTVQAPPPRPTQRERRQHFAPIRLPPLPPTLLERTLNLALMVLMIVISLLFLRSFFIKG